MAQGKVRWFDEKKGFGFIAQENDRDVFVHYSAIQGQGFRTLKEGEPVSYEVENGPHGVHAVNVIRLEIVMPPNSIY